MACMKIWKNEGTNNEVTEYLRNKMILRFDLVISKVTCT